MGRRVLSVVNTVFIVSMGVISSLVTLGAASSVPGTNALDISVMDGLSVVAGIGAAIMLVWRHRWPDVVLGIALVPPLLLTSDSLAALIALAALAAARRDVLLWLATPLVFAATALALWRDAGWHEPSQIMGSFIVADGPGKIVGVLAVATMLTGIPLIVGFVRGTRADLRERERREAALRSEVTRQEERSRIAHEMHDVLGHRLTLLSLQAGALEVSEPTAGDAARTVRSTAKQSLDDLRQVIGVLRDGRDFQLTGPAPTLADLPALVTETRRAGLPVNLTVLVDQASAAPAQLGMAVYRIAQESLTNVLRHAPGAPVDVTVRGAPGAGVTLDIVNPMPPPTVVRSPGSGSGLTGVAERVTALGGRATTGPTPNGTFAVQVWLPWPGH